MSSYMVASDKPASHARPSPVTESPDPDTGVDPSISETVTGLLELTTSATQQPRDNAQLGHNQQRLTLGDRLARLRSYELSRFSGTGRDVGKFENFYSRLCRYVLESCGSLDMMPDILLHYLSSDLSGRIVECL